MNWITLQLITYVCEEHPRYNNLKDAKMGDNICIYKVGNGWVPTPPPKKGGTTNP